MLDDGPELDESKSGAARDDEFEAGAGCEDLLDGLLDAGERERERLRLSLRDDNDDDCCCWVCGCGFVLASMRRSTMVR